MKMFLLSSCWCLNGRVNLLSRSSRLCGSIDELAVCRCGVGGVACDDEGESVNFTDFCDFGDRGYRLSGVGRVVELYRSGLVGTSFFLPVSIQHTLDSFSGGWVLSLLGVIQILVHFESVAGGLGVIDYDHLGSSIFNAGTDSPVSFHLDTV